MLATVLRRGGRRRVMMRRQRGVMVRRRGPTVVTRRRARVMALRGGRVVADRLGLTGSRSRRRRRHSPRALRWLLLRSDPRLHPLERLPTDFRSELDIRLLHHLDLLQQIDTDGNDALAHQVHLPGCTATQIDDAPAYERSAVIDSDDDGSPVQLVGHLYPAIERERPMCGRETVGMESLAGRGTGVFPIERCLAVLSDHRFR